MLMKMTRLSTSSPAAPAAASATLDPAEVERFRRMAAEWWDPNGKFRPLHQIGPVRLTFVRDALIGHFGLTPGGTRPLDGLNIVDIGCGGGLMCEPLTRLGARVTGIDPAERNIGVAREHARGSDLDIDYRTLTVEELLAEGRTFDAGICLEVVEHVPDVRAFLKACAGLVRPGGVMIVSTLNRTLKSYALAIVAVEYVLGWLPRGTHDWNRFITPDELKDHCAAAGLDAPRFEGFVYNPMTDTWRLAPDTDVNYLASAAKAGSS